MGAPHKVPTPSLPIRSEVRAAFAAQTHRPEGQEGVRQQWSVSRFHHWLPGREVHPKVMERPAAFHHEITDTLLPQADPVFDDATALHTTVDLLDP